MSSSSKPSYGAMLLALVKFLFFAALVLAPFAVSAALVLYGRDWTHSWSVKPDIVARLETTDYTYAVEQLVQSDTTTGNAFGLSFLSDCPDVGAIARFYSNRDGEPGYLTIQIIRRNAPQSDSSRSNTEGAPNSTKCRYLAVRVTGHQENHGHQLPRGSLVGHYYYQNPNNSYPDDTIILLKTDVLQEVDSPFNKPAGWSDVALLEFSIASAYTYLTPLSARFSAYIPFDRTFEVIVGTYQPRVLERLRSTGAPQEILASFQKNAFGLATFAFNVSTAPEIEIASSGGWFGVAHGFVPSTIFRDASAAESKFSFGFLDLNPSSQTPLRGWLLERPSDYVARQTFAVTVGAAIFGLGLAFLAGYLLEVLGIVRGRTWTRWYAKTEIPAGKKETPSQPTGSERPDGALLEQVSQRLGEKDDTIRQLKTEKADLQSEKEELNRKMDALRNAETPGE